MTHQELLDAQRKKFLKLAKRLDTFWNGLYGSDPKWEIVYPVRSGKVRWGRCYACRYKNITSFGFSNGLRVGVYLGEDKFDFDFSHVLINYRSMLESADDVLDWLNVVEKDPAAANRRIALEYPPDYRMGIIPRSVAERYVPGLSIGKALGKAKSKEFSDIFDSGYFDNNENAFCEDMTANKFFEYCRIAYIASEEKRDHLNKSLSAREMYDEYSDGRYGALLDIDPDSPKQFLDWLDGKIPCERHGGDHPWEIKRGGNSTHIDLYVCRPNDHDWFLVDKKSKSKPSLTVKVGLRGHHIGRIVETVKMFLAIKKAGLPIWISDPKSVRNRILGLDWIGIIPEYDYLHYGWQEFPGEFDIADVMHFSEFGRNRRHALPFVSWKPLSPILPKKFEQ